MKFLTSLHRTRFSAVLETPPLWMTSPSCWTFRWAQRCSPTPGAPAIHPEVEHFLKVFLSAADYLFPETSPADLLSWEWSRGVDVTSHMKDRSKLCMWNGSLLRFRLSSTFMLLKDRRLPASWKHVSWYKNKNSEEDKENLSKFHFN